MTICGNFVQRRSDLLAAVDVDVTKNITLRDIATVAGKAVEAGKIYGYLPTKACTILVFHTETGAKVPGGIRGNFALTKEKTKDGTDFPKQPDTGFGQATDASHLDKPFTDVAVEGAGMRLYTHNASTPLTQRVINAIASKDGWGNIVCLHTDKWGDGPKDGMNVLTSVKHISCTDAEAQEFEATHRKITAEKRTAGVSERELSDIAFLPLQALLDVTAKTYNTGTELEKGNMHYDALPAEVRDDFKARGEVALAGVTRLVFNDLSFATLAQNNGFAARTIAKL